MSLDEIIAIADDHYPDGLVGRHHEGEKVYDTLAEFIAVELKDTYDPDASSEAQLREALRAMETARDELEEVVTGFRRSLKGQEAGGRSMTLRRIDYQEAKLDQEADEIEDAYNSGAITEHEARMMHAAIDRQRLALYARQEGDEDE